jgi:hypothetical protein
MAFPGVGKAKTAKLASAACDAIVGLLRSWRGRPMTDLGS